MYEWLKTFHQEGPGMFGGWEIACEEGQGSYGRG